MLQDSDVNLYQQNKVVLKEEAFTIRGKKQKTRAQKEQVIYERRKQARAIYEKIKKEQAKKMLEEPINLLKPSKDEFIYKQNNIDEIMFRPDYKPAVDLMVGMNVQGLKGVQDFDVYNQKNKQKKKDKLEQSRIHQMQQSMNGTVLPENVTMEFGGQSELQIPEVAGNQNDVSRMSETSNVFETIAPAKGVALQQAEYKQRVEEAERIR